MKYSISSNGWLKHQASDVIKNTLCWRDSDMVCNDSCSAFELEDGKLTLRCCQRKIFDIKVSKEYSEGLK